MIRLIHGGNTLASFRALQEILGRFDELSVTRLPGGDLDIKTLRESLETPSFTGARLVVVEDLSRNRSQTTLAEVKKYLGSAPDGSELVFYERKTLPPESPILGFTKEVKSFPEPPSVNIFEWADRVGERKLGPALSGWDRLIQAGEEPEYVFLMLVRQFRLILQLKLGGRIKAPDFVRGKISNQAKLWSERELRQVYRRLLEIDWENKTGLAPLELNVTSLLASVCRR